MASPSSIAIFVLFLLSATLVLPSHAAGLLGNPLSINGLQVVGRLFCSVDGNSCPTCSGLGGVNVTITCNNGTTSLGSLLTDTNGFLDGVIGLTNGILFSTLFPCFATVQLPVANCTLLPPTGILQAPVNFLGSLITGILGGVLGLLAQVSVGLFILVGVTV